MTQRIQIVALPIAIGLLVPNQAATAQPGVSRPSVTVLASGPGFDDNSGSIRNAAGDAIIYASVSGAKLYSWTATTGLQLLASSSDHYNAYTGNMEPLGGFANIQLNGARHVLVEAGFSAVFQYEGFGGTRHLLAQPEDYFSDCEFLPNNCGKHFPFRIVTGTQFPLTGTSGVKSLLSARGNGDFDACQNYPYGGGVSLVAEATLSSTEVITTVRDQGGVQSTEPCEWFAPVATAPNGDAAWAVIDPNTGESLSLHFRSVTGSTTILETIPYPNELEYSELWMLSDSRVLALRGFGNNFQLKLHDPTTLGATGVIADGDTVPMTDTAGVSSSGWVISSVLTVTQPVVDPAGLVRVVFTGEASKDGTDVAGLWMWRKPATGSPSLELLFRDGRVLPGLTTAVNVGHNRASLNSRGQVVHVCPTSDGKSAVVGRHASPTDTTVLEVTMAAGVGQYLYLGCLQSNSVGSITKIRQPHSATGPFNASSTFLGEDGFYDVVVTADPGSGNATYVIRDVLECPSLRGDFNFDGVVNLPDLNLLQGGFGQTVPCFTRGDMDGNGVVNTLDLTDFLGDFGQSCQ